MLTYAGVQMFMEKLKQIINNSNHNPLCNNLAIIIERPQFQLLYDEMDSMIQPFFIDQHIQDLERVKDLKQRFTDAAEEAEYIVDLYLSGVNPSLNFDYVHDDPMPDKGFISFRSVDYFNRSRNLDDVRRKLNYVKVEFMSMRTDSIKRGSSETTLNQSAPAQISGTRNVTVEEINRRIIVGLDGDTELIKDKLVEDQKKLDVVSVVGMGGIGKTTLATKVFNDGYVKHHFHVRVWVTVSQTYDKRGVLIQILESIRGQLHLDETSESELRGLVHKQLMGKRYLVVIDDIWHTETWDNLKVFFPHDNNNGSRILLTTRVTEVAKHANSNGLIHQLGYLSKENSWELLCQKVFHGNECPKWSIKPGIQIVESCKGLPLAVVVVAGVLARKAWNEKFWVEIARTISSYIVDDKNGCVETLGFSYNHLPLHLRECFLYLGGFPEDHEFQVQRLIWLWLAEGFIQEDGNRSLEVIAEGYLMDLIDRNLVIIASRSKLNGGVKACKVHDLVRELCLRKAKEERFTIETDTLMLSFQFLNSTTPPYKPVRMFMNKNTYSLNFHSTHPSVKNLRSILTGYFVIYHDVIEELSRSFRLLRVLDLENCKQNDLPKSMELLVHLRYLAIWISSKAGFPSSICNLWGLQTLIYIAAQDSMNLPSNISDLVNLRHLWSYHRFASIKRPFILTSIEKPMSLQVISHVVLGEEVFDFQKCFPYIKELTCTSYSEKKYDFQSLTCLEKLKLIGKVDRRMSSTVTNLLMLSSGNNHITFPTTLTTLTLAMCGLPWNDMSIIQSLPNLQVLKLKLLAFEGNCWNTYEQVFRQLKYLKLDSLDIKLWEASSTSFPCLKQLEILHCPELEEFPLEIGDIPTLELINIDSCRDSVGESARRIQEEQHYLGNYDLKVDVISMRTL